MPRRSKGTNKAVPPDAKYQNATLAKVINKIMVCGKKSTAERVVYDCLQIIEQQQKKEPIAVFEQALKNAAPLLEVKPRRVGGATYQVPVEVEADRGMALAVRWILQAARARTGKSMAERLAAELTDAANGQGTTIKKREDTHKMAEANRAFAHYHW